MEDNPYQSPRTRESRKQSTPSDRQTPWDYATFVIYGFMILMSLVAIFMLMR